MTDTDGDSGCGPEPDHVAAEVVDVAVEYVEGSELFYEFQEPLAVANRPMGVRTAQDSRPESQKFGVIRGRLVCVDQEIQVEFLAVDMPQNVHEPGFHAPAVHRSQHM
jgi:hypothetical protein